MSHLTDNALLEKYVTARTEVEAARIAVELERRGL